jgi:hypothetical protein
MRRAQTHFELIRNSLWIGTLVVALMFQMLPLFLLVMVMAFTMGVTGPGLLIVVPAALFAMLLAACWIASKRITRRAPAWRPAQERQAPKKPFRRGAVALLKTRAERYQELRDILGGDWR